MSDKKAVLHQLLAVEGDAQGVAKKISEEAKKTFLGKQDHFQGQVRTLGLFDEEAKAPAAERKELVTTVDEKLEYISEHLARLFDVVYQKDIANQKATADLVVDDIVMAREVPATFLLGMETKLKALREVLETIPTLEPGVNWIPDATAEKRGVYRTAFPIETYKSQKTIKHRVLYEATDKHPAQIDRWEDTENIGIYNTTKYSGMLSPVDKSDMLGRLDKLTAAVKKARQLANCVEVTDDAVGKKMLDFVFKG